MGKRTDYERIEADKYYTHDIKAVIPLLPFLPDGTEFVEPTAGAGHLINHLETAGHKCVAAFDILPEDDRIVQADVLFFGFDLPPCQMVITNPVWEREPLHKMIEKFRNHAPTWLLFDTGWMFTAQAKEHLPFCSKIVTVGRVNWIEGTKQSGMEDCAWYQFQKEESQTIFFGKK